jgi:hypothetical protein
MLQNLVLKVAYLHYSMVMEQITVLLVDPDQNLIFAPVLIIELETLAPFWAISNAPTHLISIIAKERSVVLDQT